MSNTHEIIEKESGGERDFWQGRDAGAYRGGGGYLSEDQTRDLVESRQAFLVIAVAAPETGFQGKGLRRVVTLSTPGDTDVMKSFTIQNKDGDDVFPGRIQMLEDFAEHLAGGGAPIPVRFSAAGPKAVTLEPADPDDVKEAV